jgi:hypothetical protein
MQAHHSQKRMQRRASAASSLRASATSYFHCEARDSIHFKSNVLPEGDQNLTHYLTKLGLPSGLCSVIQSVHRTMESRVWIIDNSLESITREDGGQLQVVDFHMKMAARAWIPNKVSRRLSVRTKNGVLH